MQLRPRANGRCIKTTNNFLDLMYKKPCFSDQKYRDRFSPMHIYAASGCVDMVKALLSRENGPNLCRYRKSKGDYTPLHCAASTGRSEILKLMVMACPESLEDVTLCGENALHIAAKNGQTKAVQTLVELVVNSPSIKYEKKKKIINAKDDFGFSVIRLAMSNRLPLALRRCLLRSNMY